MRKRFTDPVFGVVSAHERREADLFFAEMLGHAPRRQANVLAAEEDSPAYRTGELRARSGWTYVVYLEQGIVRLGLNVTRDTPDGRIGNIGWVTNNPGSLDLNPPTNKSQVCARIAVKHGAYEKNANDIRTYRRFAVFPSEKVGAAAILPMLFCLARYNNNPAVSSVLKIFYGIKDETKRTKYVDDIRTRLVGSYEQQLRVTDSRLSDPERKQNATSMANTLLGRRTLELEPYVTYDTQYLEQAILDVESARDMARTGLLFSCNGWRNEAEAKAAYARDSSKTREIQALLDSSEVQTELKGVLRCGSGIPV